ncbi:zinc finger, CCHC-type containing protein [Tanacetum coccineum]
MVRNVRCIQISSAKVTASLITRQVRSQQEERESKQESSSKLSQVSKQEGCRIKQENEQQEQKGNEQQEQKGNEQQERKEGSRKQEKFSKNGRNIRNVDRPSGNRGTVDEKKNYTTKAIIFQTLPEDIHLQDAKHKDAKDVWESIRVRYLGADRVQKARLQTLRSELEMLKMKENETINDFSGKIGSIMAKFKSLGSRLDEEVAVRKLLNSALKKYLPIIASIEQYSEIETMSFEEAGGRLKAYEERLKSHDEKEEDQGGLSLTSSEFFRGGRGRGRGFGRGERGRGKSSGQGKKGECRIRSPYNLWLLVRNKSDLEDEHTPADYV